MNKYKGVALWTPPEVTCVLKEIQGNLTLEQISKKHGRSVSNIRSKLKAVAADMYIKGDMPFSKIQEITGIEKHELVVSRATLRAVTTCPPSPTENIEHDTVEIEVRDNQVESPETVCDQISRPLSEILLVCSAILYKAIS